MRWSRHRSFSEYEGVFMTNVIQKSVRTNSINLVQFLIGVGCIVAISNWVFGLSFWHSMTIVLSVSVAFLMSAAFLLIGRVERLEKSRQNRLTRIYNKEGQEVMNRWTDQLDSGHWVTITTDVINHEVLYAEHTMTDENTNSGGRATCIREEHEYNRSAVWGDHYKRPVFRRRPSLKSRLRSIRT